MILTLVEKQITGIEDGIIISSLINYLILEIPFKSVDKEVWGQSWIKI